jgi:site-specific DNA-cytosine methylase
MKLLELFAGSRSVGNAADKLGFDVFSVDWTPYEKINLAIDIQQLQIDDVPFTPDIIWASPDCTTYTIAAISTHRNGVQPKSEYAKKCDAVNMHFIELIKQWEVINPNMVFFIENPRGMLRKMPFMQEFIRHTIWYCQYGDDRAKPTDIWTNSKTWIPRPMCHNGNKNCHHQPAPRGSKTGTQGKKGSYERSKIPNELCVEILGSLK